MTGERTRRIVVFGSRKDPHVTRVVRALAALQVESIVLDYDGSVDLTISTETGLAPVVRVGNVRLNTDDVPWARLKLVPGMPWYFQHRIEGETEFEQRRRHSLMEQQWLAAYDVVLSTVGQRAINNVSRRDRSLAKPVQQAVAARCGLRSPATIVSNCKRDLVAFSDRFDELITKPISAVRLPRLDHASKEPLMTYAVSASDLREADDGEFACAPMMLQQRLSKDAEFRVVVTNSDYRAYRVETQAHDLTKVDWRRGGGLLDFQRCELPGDIIAGLHTFLQITDRDYGSFDLILDRDRQYWFLECNPDGQWGWLEDGADPDVSSMLARQFLTAATV